MHTDIKKKVVSIQDVGYTGEQGLSELVLKSKEVLAKEEIAQEKAAVDHFLETLNKKPSFVAYGEDEVKKAIDLGAVDFLLVSEKIDAKLAEELATKVEGYGGKWLSISKDSHEGAQIESLGGLAAVLRYPIDKS